MKGATRLPWIEAGEVDIRNKGGNIFDFTFSRDNYRDAIWNKRPWSIANYFLNLKQRDGCGDPRNIYFQEADMWIHVHSLPPMYKSIGNMEVVGNLYFRYIKCNRAAFQQGIWRRYIRILVKVRIDETLQVFGELPTAGREIIEFKYEKVTEYCLYCGKMGHTKGKCEDRDEEINNGGTRDLPEIFDHCIIARSALRDPLGGLNVRNSPTSHSISPGQDNRHEKDDGRFLETRSQMGPTDLHPSIMMLTSEHTSGTGAFSFSLHSSYWQSATTAELYARTSLDSRGYQAIKAGLVPREIEMDMEEGEGRLSAQVGEDVNPKWTSQTPPTPTCPPGFEAHNKVAQTGLNPGLACLGSTNSNPITEEPPLA
ncbi:hypothetical protein LINGRAHAP2_LOCUS10746 [Linum grandiflorum]